MSTETPHHQLPKTVPAKARRQRKGMEKMKNPAAIQTPSSMPCIQLIFIVTEMGSCDCISSLLGDIHSRKEEVCQSWR